MTPEHKEQISIICCRLPPEDACEAREMTEEEIAEYKLFHGYGPYDYDEFMNDLINYVNNI